jgi:hypothetical protein
MCGYEQGHYNTADDVHKYINVHMKYACAHICQGSFQLDLAPHRSA